MSAAATAPAARPKLVEPGKDIAAIRQAGNQIAKEAGGQMVSDYFQANKDAILAVLPKHMTAERMLKIGLRCLRTTPKLMQCTLSSLFGAIVTCAQFGLEPNTPQGHIYLIPFENSKKGVTEVQIVIGYKGLIDLARRSGQIASISSHPVYKNDPFKVMFGTEELITHEPTLSGDRGEIIGFYSVAKLKDGGTQLEFMSVAEVNEIRDRSQGYRTAVRFRKDNQPLNSPWATNYPEMGRKTVIRRLCKYLPSSIEMANAIAMDERADLNMGQGLDSVLEGEYSVVSDDEGDSGREDQTAPQKQTASIEHDQTPNVTLPQEENKDEAVGRTEQTTSAGTQKKGDLF